MRSKDLKGLTITKLIEPNGCNFFLKILLTQANHPILARLDTFLKLMKLAKKGGGMH